MYGWNRWFKFELTLTVCSSYPELNLKLLWRSQILFQVTEGYDTYDFDKMRFNCSCIFKISLEVNYKWDLLSCYTSQILKTFLDIWIRLTNLKLPYFINLQTLHNSPCIWPMNFNVLKRSTNQRALHLKKRVKGVKILPLVFSFHLDMTSNRVLSEVYY